MKTFTMTKKMWIAWILIFIGAILIFGSFFINDTPECNASITATIFTPSFITILIGIFFIMAGIAMADVEYHQQTGWIIKRIHKRKY